MPEATPDPLRERLRRATERARLTHAAWQPGVASYLFEGGFLPTARELTGEPGSEELLEQLWQLQMESIGSRDFGVSSDFWRRNPNYHDRYFALLWLDLIPGILGKVEASQRLELLVKLFNLGENLVRASRSIASGVAEHLHTHQDRICTEGLDPVVQEALAAAGVLGDGSRGAGVGDWARLGPPRLVHTELFEADFVPGGLTFLGPAVCVRDATRPVSLVIKGSGSACRLVDMEVPEGPLSSQTLPLQVDIGRGQLQVTASGQVLWTPTDGEEVDLGAVDVRGLADIAISGGGRIGLVRKFSQRVELRDPVA